MNRRATENNPHNPHHSFNGGRKAVQIRKGISQTTKIEKYGRATRLQTFEVTEPETPAFSVDSGIIHLVLLCLLAVLLCR